MCGKMTIMTPEQCQWHRSSVFVVNFYRFYPYIWWSIGDFKKVNTGSVDEFLLHLHTSISPPNYSSFTDWQIRIKVIFTRSITGLWWKWKKGQLLGITSKSGYNFDTKIKCTISLQYLKKEVRNEVDFFRADKHQSFLQVSFNTLSIKVCFKVILSLLMGIIQYSQGTLSNKFAISLHYLKKDRDRVHLLRAVKYHSFYKMVLSFLMEVATPVLSTSNRKL